MRKPSQSGNVLFLILIAVALFAALSYAVTSSSRSGSGNAGKEKNQSAIAVIENYATAMQMGVQRMMAINNCADTDLSFFNINFHDPYDFFNGDARCNFFDKNGAGVAWQRPPREALEAGATDYVFNGITAVVDVGTNDTGPTGMLAMDLMMFVRVSRAMCLAYNQKVGIINTGGNPPQDQYSNMHDAGGYPPNFFKFGASGIKFYNNNFLGQGAGNQSIEVRGQPTGCYQTLQGDRGYFIYFVLLPR